MADATTTIDSFEAADRHLRPAMSMTQLMFIGASPQIGSGWLFAVHNRRACAAWPWKLTMIG
jgi:hypothetical protein